MTANTGLGAADVADPQTLNHYAYVRNNPLNLIDPTGMQMCTEDCPSLPEFPDAWGDGDSFVTVILSCDEMDTSCVNNTIVKTPAPLPDPSQVKPPKPQTPTHPYLTCVANSGNEASLQGLLGLGNSKIAGAFLGNPISDLMNAFTGNGGSPAAVDAGLYAATKAAPAVPNVSVSYTSTTITASPSEFSIITNEISAYLPLGDIASGAADVLGGFTKLVQAPIDITASAFGAVTCAAGE